ncbi:MAG: cytidylate kinase-like family protein, partial [Nitrospiraceae bacterium]|nr:cytidylate kinase-like family protein [Nitrospiraceae bacterium]
HLKVSAPFDDRVKEYSQRLSVPIDEAEKQLSMIDDREKSFYKDLCNANVGGIELFHLELNSSKFSVEDATDVAMKAFKLVVKEQQ